MQSAPDVGTEGTLHIEGENSVKRDRKDEDADHPQIKVVGPDGWIILKTETHTVTTRLLRDSGPNYLGLTQSTRNLLCLVLYHPPKRKEPTSVGTMGELGYKDNGGS